MNVSPDYTKEKENYVRSHSNSTHIAVKKHISQVVTLCDAHLGAQNICIYSSFIISAINGQSVSFNWLSHKRFNSLLLLAEVISLASYSSLHLYSECVNSAGWPGVWQTDPASGERTFYLLCVTTCIAAVRKPFAGETWEIKAKLSSQWITRHYIKWKVWFYGKDHHKVFDANKQIL